MGYPPSLDTLLEGGCEAPDRAGPTAEKVCRSRGGESCAFDGAAIVLVPIADAAHVIHGPISCAGNSWGFRGSLSSHGDLDRRGLTTSMTELDVVYGAEGKLRDAVRSAHSRLRPAAVFVYATCVSGLIGEDIEPVCREMAAELGVPVVPVNAPGFVGPKNLGNRIAGEALVRHVIGTAEPVCTTPTDIALIGEYNIAGDLWLVEPLLRRAGIRLLSRITGDARFNEIAWAHRARLSVLVCSRALVNVAAHLERSYGIPCVDASFFGPTQTALALRTIAAALEELSPDASGVLASAEAVIAEEEAALEARIAPHRLVLTGRRAVLYSGGVKSWSMVSALTDLRIEVVAVGTRKSSYEDEARVRELLGPDVPLIEDITPARIRQVFAETGATILVAGGRNKYLAAKEGWAFVDVNQERHTAYAGYDGFVNLARDLAESARFYEPEAGDSATEGGEVPRPEHPQRALTVDPLAHPQSLGACMAIQGVHRAVPLLHGAQGCSFLGKVLLTNHFREPIALATTKLFTEDVILGDARIAVAAAEKLVHAQAPDLVAVVSSATAEVKGDDVVAAVRHVDGGDSVVVAVPAPDYAGGLEDGYLGAVKALVSLAEAPDGEPPRVVPGRVTVIAGGHLTPADFVELRETVEAFGLEPVLVPDLGALDGSRQGLSAMAVGGVTVNALRELGASGHTLVVGASLQPAAEILHGRFGTPHAVFSDVGSLAGTDALLHALAELSGAPIPPRLARRRAVLVDALRDAHTLTSGATAAPALECDAAAHLTPLLAEMGMRVPLAVIATAGAAASSVRAERVLVGDLSDVPAADVVLGSSHVAETAERLGAAHHPYGFPLHEAVGGAHRLTFGYAGALATAEAIAQLLLDTHPHASPSDAERRRTA